jgi:hypothetical protein
MTDTETSDHGERLRMALALCVLACALAAAALAGSQAGAAKVKVLGHTKHNPKPACPKNTDRNPCESVGRVTGFQTRADGQKLPFKVPADGHIVAWAIDLSKPKKPQRTFFGKIFCNHKYGKDPAARVAIVKRVKKHDYKLKSQSPAQNLKTSLGEKAYFTINKPLRVRKGDTLALTIPTWASNFANGLSAKNNKWRGSRTHDNCSPKNSSLKAIKAFANKSNPQQKVGSTRPYACNYNTARLMYWGWFVPSGS